MKNVLQVIEYLKAEGWKVAKSAAYAHVKKGMLRPREDGNFHERDVLKYARTWLKRLDGSTIDSSITELSRRQKADAESAEYDARFKKIKAEALEGKYVFRETMIEELAVQAAAFKDAITTFLHAQAEEVVSIVSGDVSRIPDLIEFLMARLDEHFFKYAEEWGKRGPLISIENIVKSKIQAEIEEEVDNEEDYEE